MSAAAFGPRLTYALDAFVAQLGWTWRPYTPAEERADDGSSLYLAYGRAVSYGELRRAVLIEPSGLLSQRGVAADYRTRYDWYEGIRCPEGGDPLAAAFYLLTCYEEWASREADEHGRVPAASLSHVREGLARVPVVDRLWLVLAKALVEAAGYPRTPVALLPSPGYSSLDVDSVYALAGKPFASKLRSALWHVMHGDWRGLRAVVSALRGGRDPFDTFDYLRELHRAHGLTPYVFVLMGYATGLDPAWPLGDERYRGLVARLSDWVHLGVHPSYESSRRTSLIKSELGALRAIAGGEVRDSRQHYLRIAWPVTFRALLATGVTDDYSLGWPDELGFRAGTARSFTWYDLDAERATGLALHPPHVMDVTGRYYLGLSPKQFSRAALEVHEAARGVGGGLRLLWHNSNLGPAYGWGPFRSTYEALIACVAEA